MSGARFQQSVRDKPFYQSVLFDLKKAIRFKICPQKDYSSHTVFLRKNEPFHKQMSPFMNETMSDKDTNVCLAAHRCSLICDRGKLSC